MIKATWTTIIRCRQHLDLPNFEVWRQVLPPAIQLLDTERALHINNLSITGCHSDIEWMTAARH